MDRGVLSCADVLRAEAARAYPREACGFLLGDDEGVREAVSVRNRHARPCDAFAIDPCDTLAVALEAERRGLRILGTWHSHPDGDAEPSDEDRAAAVPGWRHEIV